MSTDITPASSPFDAIKRTDEHGGEYWSARELMPLLGYDRWERFADAIERAAVAAANSGTPATDHFRGAAKKVYLGSGAARTVVDWHMTRYGAYLVAMNGDPRKREIARAQTYFAVQTRRAETSLADMDPLDQAQMMLDAIRANRDRLRQLEDQQAITAAKVAAIEGSYDWFTALAFAKLHSFSTERGFLQRVGTKAGAILRARGEQPVKRQDATFGSINTYPADVLADAFAALREAS